MQKTKRVLCLLLCLALAVSLCPSAAATEIVFLAVNDSIPLPLSSDTMPFSYNSLLYIPVSLFDIETLNIVPVYDSAAGTLTLSNSERSLTFDLNQSTMTNENGAIFTVQLVSRSGALFIPAVYCAYHFGLGMSSMTSLGGYTVIRFTTGSQVYDDELFIEKANNLIEYRVAQYLGTASEPQIPDTPETPDTPEEPDEPEAPDVPEEPEESLPAEIYLAVTGTQELAAAVSALASTGERAAFFFTYEEIRSVPELILQIYAAGHTIGLYADEHEQDANEALDRLLQTKALCRLTTEGTEDHGGIGRTFEHSTAQPSATKAAQVEAIPQLFLVSSDNLPQVLAIFRSAGANLHQLRETTVF